MTFVSELEPTALWRHFDTILTIPRGSKNEDRMRGTVVAIAERAGLKHDVDSTGNVVIRKPATAGHEEAPTTTLQSHLDMVNEKNADHPHDFTTDSIIPQQVGEYLTADGTTLGSDNGIGVATMLAVMEATDLTHGPLEFLFTIDEETGLTGASELDASLVTGRQLINLDSEEEGNLYVGCAGGGESWLTLDLVTVPATRTTVTLAVALKGLKGGHSGCDIHLQRGNAIKLLVRLLWTAYLDTPFLLANVEGGSAHNAIPREAFALVAVERTCKNALLGTLETDLAAVRTEYGSVDPGIELHVDETDTPTALWDRSTSKTVLSLLNALPHGVAAMSYDIPDLVETSINLATVKPDGNHLTVSLSSRSSIDSALESLRRQVRALSVLAGAKVQEDTPYPGWKPNLESRLLDVTKAVHTKEFGREPAIRAIHAGLEGGILGKKAPGMDMISFGPIIEFPHSPDERVQIASVGRFYRLLTATLEHLA